MKYLLVFGILFLLLLLACSKTSNPAEAQAAVEAATEWLALIDSGKYVESWQESSKIFQNAVSKSTWEGQLNTVRVPLGKLIGREVKSTQYSTTLPGAPDGEYVVITFKTVFEKKKSAIETVTPMKDESGIWRVSGYYIR
jgi:hypothetical protein